MNLTITPAHKSVKNAAALLWAVVLFGAAQAAAQTTRFVKPAAVGTADGSTWNNASDDLQLMINNSVAGDTIWVAGGTYKPNRKANATGTVTPNDRDNAFVLKDSVQIFGGFAGTETTFSQRIVDFAGNPSILTGDFNGDDTLEVVNDTLSLGNNAENAYHVLVAIDSLTPATKLDSFYVRGGNSNANNSITIGQTTVYHYAGGGLINLNSSPTFTAVQFIRNQALYGGGVYNRGANANATFSNVGFQENTAGFGGGVTNWEGASPTFTNSVVYNNRADAGGGVYNYNGSNPVFTYVEIYMNFASLGSGGGVFNNASAPVITNATVSDNRAAAFGGGMFNNSNAAPQITNAELIQNTAQTGGGIYATANSNPILNNVTIKWNEATAGNGGGYYNFESAPVLNGVSFIENTATDFGGGMVNWSATAQITGSQFIGNTAANGAGVFNYDNANAVFTNVAFIDNSTPGDGGGAYNRSGGNAVFTNCFFVDNSAANGGAMRNYENASPILTNLTITNNEATVQGGGLSNNDASPLVRNSIIFGNINTNGSAPEVFNFGASAPVFSYSLVGGITQDNIATIGTDGGNNVFGDPMFADEPTGDYRLTNQSIAVNSGSNSYYAEGQTPDISTVITDLLGSPRFYEDGTVDLGAFELQEALTLVNYNLVSVTCYPNPVVNTLKIEALQPIENVTVYSLNGQQINSATWNSSQNTVNMTGVQEGIYLLKIVAGNNSIVKQIVKK